ncbi:MAG: sigma factor-like helix-turn-helix DNA-binding protein [Planctomycetota bacterium]
MPENEGQLDRVAVELLRIFHAHGYRAAFELLFDLTSPLVGRMVEGRLRGLDAELEPEELVARVFEKFYYRRGPAPASGSDHAFRDAALEAIDGLIDEAVKAATFRHPFAALLDDLPPGLVEPTARGRSPFDLPREMLLEVVAQNFASLPELTRLCFYLFLVERRSLPDIAHELGITLSDVSQRIREAHVRAYRLAEGRERDLGLDRPDDEEEPFREMDGGGT